MGAFDCCDGSGGHTDRCQFYSDRPPKTAGPSPKALGAEGPFRAEDFDFDVTVEGVEGCCPESRHLSDRANAKLAPLWEALEELDAHLGEFRKGSPLEQSVAAAYRSLKETK